MKHQTKNNTNVTRRDFVGFLRKAGATEANIARIGYGNARELYKLTL